MEELVKTKTSVAPAVKASRNNPLRPVYIVDGARTPFLKARGHQGLFSASDLAVNCGRALLARQPFEPTEIGEVILGCIIPSQDEANIGRIVSLRLGCGKDVPGWTVQRNCASGMQALDSAAKDIALGRYELVLAGGTEAMSRAPLIFRPEMVNWLADLNAAKSFSAKLKTLIKFRPHFLKPIISLIHGLSDPLIGMGMGQTAEELAYRFHITRKEMDAFALQSQQRLAAAQDHGYLKEIVPIFDQMGHVYDVDDGLRRDSSMEKLAQLKPNFERKFGSVTAGNSSQITDGASVLLLASEEAIQKYKLPVLGRIVDTQWVALEPAVMGLGAMMAPAKILLRNHLSLSDIDYWEMNEAFASQVLACLKAFDDEKFCRENFNHPAFGTIDQSRLNVDGGAIAMGHPVGASGARIVLHLLDVLQRNNAKVGIAGICIGGGQGGAMLLERI